jgi:glucosamine kinase
MPETVLAIDAGQTGIRAQPHGDGAREGVHDFPGIRTDQPLAPQLRAVVERVGLETGLAFSTVAVGTSGLTDAGGEAKRLLDACATLGVARALVAHDSVTSYLGALGDHPGVVVASGTGVVTLAVGEASVARVDGWGYLMGDAGSGYWLGIEAFRAVMRAHDGRGPATSLTGVITEDFPNVEHAYVELQSDPNRVRRIASYAPRVTGLAATDAVAADICARAAGELAHSVATGLRQVGEDARPDPVVCCLGRVLGAAEIRDPFVGRLRQTWPGVELREPTGTGLDGAALLTTLAQDSALGQRVQTAVSPSGRSAALR